MARLTTTKSYEKEKKRNAEETDRDPIKNITDLRKKDDSSRHSPLGYLRNYPKPDPINQTRIAVEFSMMQVQISIY